VSGPASSGPNFGVHFGLDLIAASDPDNFNFANNPSGTSAMAVGGNGGDYSMVSAIIRQLSFSYSATSDTTVTVSFTTGPSQTYTLAANDGSCTSGPAFCMWNLATLDLGSRLATSVDSVPPRASARSTMSMSARCRYRRQCGC